MSVLIFCGADESPNSSNAKNGVAQRGRWRQTTGSICMRLLDALQTKTKNIEISRTITQLIDRFHRPQAAPAVLVLVIDRKKTLEALISARDLFEGIPNIVVLAGENLQTLHGTYALSPRYIGYDENDFGEVTTVLENLITMKER